MFYSIGHRNQSHKNFFGVFYGEILNNSTKVAVIYAKKFYKNGPFLKSPFERNIYEKKFPPNSLFFRNFEYLCHPRQLWQLWSKLRQQGYKSVAWYCCFKCWQLSVQKKLKYSDFLFRHHDFHHNDTKQKDIQHLNTQHYDILHNDTWCSVLYCYGECP